MFVLLCSYGLICSTLTEWNARLLKAPRMQKLPKSWKNMLVADFEPTIWQSNLRLTTLEKTARNLPIEDFRRHANDLITRLDVSPSSRITGRDTTAWGSCADVISLHMPEDCEGSTWWELERDLIAADGRAGGVAVCNTSTGCRTRRVKFVAVKFEHSKGGEVYCYGNNMHLTRPGLFA